MDSEFDSERLLSLLEAHGHAFLKSVGSERKASEELLDTDANADEWQGINTNSPPHQCSEDESSEIGTRSFHHSSLNIIPSQEALKIQMINLSPTILQPILSSTLMLLRENL